MRLTAIRSWDREGCALAAGTWEATAKPVTVALGLSRQAFLRLKRRKEEYAVLEGGRAPGGGG